MGNTFFQSGPLQWPAVGLHMRKRANVFIPQTPPGKQMLIITCTPPITVWAEIQTERLIPLHAVGFLWQHEDPGPRAIEMVVVGHGPQGVTSAVSRLLDTYTFQALGQIEGYGHQWPPGDVPPPEKYKHLWQPTPAAVEFDKSALTQELGDLPAALFDAEGKFRLRESDN